MNIPGFTAEASIDRAGLAYRLKHSLSQDNRRAYPAQSVYANRDYFVPYSWRWPILEPNCVQICIRGHCRWICF